MAGAIHREPAGQGISDEGNAPARQILSRHSDEGEGGARGRQQHRKTYLHDDWAGQLKHNPARRSGNQEVAKLEGSPAGHDAVLDLELDDELSAKAGRHYAATLATNRAAVTAVPTTDRTRWWVSGAIMWW